MVFDSFLLYFQPCLAVFTTLQYSSAFEFCFWKVLDIQIDYSRRQCIYIYNIWMDKQSEKINVKTSQIFFNIADEDMEEFFVQLIEQQLDKEDEPILLQDNQKCVQQETVEDKSEKNVVSRLQIEIEKNNLNFVPVYGEIFIMLLDCQLIGQNKKDRGKLLVTNYRLAFFKKSKKRVDVPFGFISHTKFIDKSHQICIHLKHAFFWKFQAYKKKQYDQLKIFTQLYVKASSVNSSFAFIYASKCPIENKRIYFVVDEEYTRMKVKGNQSFIEVQNKQFQICTTYPQKFFVSESFSESKLKNLSKSWNLGRFPILTYLYRSIQKTQTGLWRSAQMIQDKNNLMGIQGKYLKSLHSADSKLLIFDVDNLSQKKHVQENEICGNCNVFHLIHEPKEVLKTAYEGMINSFSKKKQFIKNILDSKWYDYILRILQSVTKISNKILNQCSVLIRCQNGYDRSAQISALVQLILEPYYRTIQGFAVLIQKQFNYFSYPFASRLGIQSQNDEQIPLFIQFLDCVSQLIHINPMSFEFNGKFLSKLSNIMYTSLFGTFIANSRRQIIKYNVQAQTVPIWSQLISQLTKNAFYQQRQGILKVTSHLSQIRLWKEHFWYLTTPSKDTYKIHPLVQDNEDYVNIQCMKVIVENDHLRKQINSQRQQIKKLRDQIEKRKQKLPKS